MGKTEVYSWRLSPVLKAALEEAARSQKTTVAQLLERMVVEHLPTLHDPDDEAEQRRLHAAAEACFGGLEGGPADLAESASRRVRELLEKETASRHVGQGTH